MRRSRLFVIPVIVGAALLAASCSGLLGGEPEKPPVTLAYVEWAHAVAITHVAEVILEDNGFDVTLSSSNAAEMWQAVADGSADAHFAAWLPTTHGSFYGTETNGEYTDQVVKLSANYVDARVGLVVPSYTNIDSLEDLDGAGAQFGEEIQGIDPGAGLMSTTQDAIDNDVYGLGNWALLEGSGSDMTTALGQAYDNQEDIVVTGWRPHYKFGKWDLTLLDDPENHFGTTENIHTIVRTGLDEQNPGAYDFLDQFDWTALDMQDVMVDISEGDGPAEAARTYVDANQTTIDAQLPDTAYFE